MINIQAAVLSLFLLVPLSAFSQSSGQATDIPVKTIATLDVPKYLGTRYEIAKFPNWFQKKCVSKTADGATSEAEGTARQIGAPDSPKLEVRFAPAWLSFLPMVWGDYWVIDLDSQYQVAAVSDPRREYLWVLSRTPQLDKKVYEDLLQRLQTQQFDVRKLELTTQSTIKN